MKTRFFLVLLLLAAQLSFAEPKIVVKGLLKNMIVMDVDGVTRTVKAGKTTPEGITLVSATPKSAIIEIGGLQREVTLSRRIGGGNYEAPKKKEVRVARGLGGHYFTPGRINNQPVSFMVDTGATAVAMNSNMAKNLNIDYTKGVPVNVHTANGVAQGYRVLLHSVSVGNVKVSNVEAVINEGAFPADILLGNSYLARVEMNVDSGVLVLQSKF